MSYEDDSDLGTLCFTPLLVTKHPDSEVERLLKDDDTFIVGSPSSSINLGGDLVVSPPRRPYSPVPRSGDYYRHKLVREFSRKCDLTVRLVWSSGWE